MESGFASAFTKVFAWTEAVCRDKQRIFAIAEISNGKCLKMVIQKIWYNWIENRNEILRNKKGKYDGYVDKHWAIKHGNEVWRKCAC